MILVGFDAREIFGDDAERSRSLSSKTTPLRSTTPSFTVIERPSRGTQTTFASSAWICSRISSSLGSARLTMPTSASPSITGTRLMRRRSISCTIPSSGVSAVTVMTFCVMISATLRHRGQSGFAAAQEITRRRLRRCALRVSG